MSNDRKASDAKVVSTQPLVIGSPNSLYLGGAAAQSHADDQRCPLDEACLVFPLVQKSLIIVCSLQPRTTYQDPLGKQRTWEHAERSVRSSLALPRSRAPTTGFQGALHIRTTLTHFRHVPKTLP